jgi:opacity protein-like surface antigen
MKMQKSFVPALLLVLMTVGLAPALAQTEAVGSKWKLGASAGYGFPIGSFRDAYDGGLTFGASGCYMFNRRHGLELAAERTNFAANNDYVVALEGLTGKHADASFLYLPVMVNFVESFPTRGSVVPYVKSGLGVYFGTVEREIAGKKQSRGENDFGFNLGGGIRLPVAKAMEIDVAARFHSIMTEDKSTQYLTIGAGVGFMF